MFFERLTKDPSWIPPMVVHHSSDLLNFRCYYMCIGTVLCILRNSWGRVRSTCISCRLRVTRIHLLDSLCAFESHAMPFISMLQHSSSVVFFMAVDVKLKALLNKPNEHQYCFYYKHLTCHSFLCTVWCSMPFLSTSIVTIMAHNWWT